MNKPSQHPFTLVELMVAMAILLLMMGFLFEFVIGAQRTWNASTGKTALFEQSQIVFEYLGKDLNNIRYKSITDEDIYFFKNATTLGFISEIKGDPIPVIYHYDATSKNLYRLEMPVDQYPNAYAYMMTNAQASNFISNFTDSTHQAPTWSSLIPLADNIHSLTISALPNNTNGYTSGDDFPQLVRIKMVLIDRTHLDDEAYNQIKNDDDKLAPYLHTFTKLFVIK